MADIEINILGWVVFAVFVAVILLMFVAEIISPLIKRRFRDKT